MVVVGGRGVKNLMGESTGGGIFPGGGGDE